MFRQSANLGMSMPSEGRARGVLGRDAPRGSSCLPCCCRRRQGATFRGIFGLGDMTPRRSFFPRRRHLRQNLGLGEGAFCAAWEVCGKSGNSAHPKRRAFGGVAAAQGRGVRRGGRAGACVPGAKNRSPAGERCGAARARGVFCRTRLSAGVRQRASRFPRRTSCRRAFP